MAFVKDIARASISPAASIFGKDKKKSPGEIQMRPTMISTTPYERPVSMIGTRGGR